MIKKLFTILLTLSLLVSLTACSNEKAAIDSTSKEETTTVKTDPTIAPQVNPEDNTLTVWCWDPNFNIAAMKEAEKVYQETNPDFVLNIVETPYSDVQTKLITAATSSQLEMLPDILLMQDNAFLKNATNYPETIADLTSTGIDFSQFSPAKVGFSTVDGKNLGVPFDSGTSIMALRTDVLTEAGYTVADFTDITWDQFIEQGQVVLDKTGKAMLSGVTSQVALLTAMLVSSGSTLFNADGTPNTTNNPALVEAMTVYKTLVDKGILLQVNAWDEYIGTLSNGTVAGTINGCWIIGSIQATPDQSGKWAITDMPRLNVPGATNYSVNGGSSWLVTSNCKNVQLAADFLGKTFGGSTAFYDTILQTSGAIGSYLPSGSSPIYSTPSAFFGGQAIFADITSFSGKIPVVNQGIYFYEASDAIAVAMTNVIGGADINAELKSAEDAIKFAIQ